MIQFFSSIEMSKQTIILQTITVQLATSSSVRYKWY